MKVRCDWCEKEIEKYPSSIKRVKHSFCGKSCADAFSGRNKKTVLQKREYNKKYYWRNRDKMVNRTRKWLKDHPEYTIPEYRLRTRIKCTYGITLEQRNEIIGRQGGMCAICKKSEAVNIDHCHKTGRVRGVLCSRCNAAIGMLLDDPGIALSASEYLEYWGGK